MYNNPIAQVIRDAFIENVSRKELIQNIEDPKVNTIGNILRNQRITLFEKAINRFLQKSGLPDIPPISQYVNEKNLLTFSLQLSGYIRDAQQELDKLSNKHACDPDLIKLYEAAAKYSVDCNEKIEGSKYIFKEHCDYQFWKVHIDDSLASAKFNNYGFIVNPNRKNLILAMPFHINSTQEELQAWSSKYLNKTLDNKAIYGSQVDVYMAHFPIEQPRGEKFALSLKTLNNPNNYFTETDMRFVSSYLKGFIGEDIKIDDKYKVIKGKAFSAEKFKQNCQNITIIGYCAGTAHASRWINAFSHIANQLYDEQTTKEALKNIFIVSYAFLPMQKESKCSGVYFMSNYPDDTMRKEPFIKMFNPELYEKCKYHPSDNPCHISLMPDNKNYVIAFPLAENFDIVNENGVKEPLANIENGHHMGLITAPNASSDYHYPNIIFNSVVKNASLGKRGTDVFKYNQSQSRSNAAHFSIISNRYAAYNK
ncbi:MAG: hypothetical protein E7020_05435 [Alphaproteobacteria bacterium]|nr:hypothetical protein [Alphaproteobacteria bacterium]